MLKEALHLGLFSISQPKMMVAGSIGPEIKNRSHRRIQSPSRDIEDLTAYHPVPRSLYQLSNFSGVILKEL